MHVWLKVKTAGIAVLWGDVQKGQTLHSCRCCDLLQLRCSFCIQKLQVDRGDGMRLARRGRGKVVQIGTLVCEAKAF